MHTVYSCLLYRRYKVHQLRCWVIWDCLTESRIHVVHPLVHIQWLIHLPNANTPREKSILIDSYSNHRDTPKDFSSQLFLSQKNTTLQLFVVSWDHKSLVIRPQVTWASCRVCCWASSVPVWPSWLNAHGPIRWGGARPGKMDGKNTLKWLKKWFIYMDWFIW